MGPPGLDPLEKDIYDDLDKGLEFVQSMCEHAAHQFLRDGDCAEEVGKIASRMAETKELADRELERVQREEPDTLKAAEDESRGRSYRPPSMRKDLTSSCAHRSDPSIKDAALAAAKASAAASTTGIVPSSKLAVDEGVEDMQPELTPNPALNKATRMM